MDHVFLVAMVAVFTLAFMFFLLAVQRKKAVFVWTSVLLLLTGLWLIGFFKQTDMAWLGLTREGLRQVQVFLTLLLLSGAMLFGRSTLAFVLYPIKPNAKLQQSLLLLAASGVLGSILSLFIAELSKSGYDSNGMQLIVWICSIFALIVIFNNLKHNLSFFLPLLFILPLILLSKILAALRLLDSDLSLLLSAPALVIYLAACIFVKDQSRLLSQESELKSLRQELNSQKATVAEMEGAVLALKDHLDQGKTHQEASGFLTIKGITDLLELEFNRFQRYQRTFTILNIKLDAEADKAGLELVIQAIKRGLRASDHCGALADYEFLILLTETELSHAMFAAEKFRQFLFETGHSASIGVAGIRKEGMDLFRLLQEAEDSRERAHSAGGNRAAMSKHSGEQHE